MWVRFTKPFDWDVPGTNGHQTIAYLPGMVENVTRACGEAAKAADKAVDHTPDHSPQAVETGDAEADRRG